MAFSDDAVGARVLIVDDDLDLGEAWVAWLARAGFDARGAADARGALALASRFRPRVALLDLGLPDLDGHTLGAELRALDPELALVAITGDDTAVKGMRSDELGFCAHLVKPIRGVDLVRAVRVVLTRRGR